MSSRLGKGFEALFSADPAPSAAQGEPLSVPLSRIATNPNQPRKDFDQSALEELAASIREKGVIQPIIVERSEEGGFVIVAGERRFRASKMAGLEEIPAFVRNVSDEDRLEVALIENIQRTDLSPLEEARAYAQLMETKGYTQEEVAKKVGKQRSTVANAVRLLKLPGQIQQWIEAGKLTPGHARAVLSLEKEDEQISFANEIMDNMLSVRAAERAAELLRGGLMNPASVKEPAAAAGEPKTRPQPRADWLDLQNRLMERLGTKVEIRGGEAGGSIDLKYYSLDDLNRLADLLLGGSA